MKRGNDVERFTNLATIASEYSLRKTDLLIVISVYKSNKNIEQHLQLLAKQSFQKFNVLIIAGAPLDMERLTAFIRKGRFGFGVVVAREKERLGCAGAVFAGQTYVLERGYEYYIYGDDDCMPVDPKLVEGLYSRRKVGYVACTRHLIAGKNQKVVEDFGLWQYGLLSRRLLEKHGLNYLPLFHGADDGEYAERLSCEPKVRISNYCEHPYIAGMRLFTLFDRSWLFFLHALVIMRDKVGIAYNVLQLSFMMPVALLFFPKYGQALFFKMTYLTLRFIYGKRAAEYLKTGFEGWMLPDSTLPGGLEKYGEKEGDYINLPASRKLKSVFVDALRCAGRDLLIVDMESMLKVFAIAAFARRCHVLLGERALLLSDNRNTALHLLKLLLLPITCLAYLCIMLLVFCPTKAFRQPKTEGYGL